jgi:hypothetical protein
MGNPVQKGYDEEDSDIIEILRRGRGINIVCDDKMIKTFTWSTEIDLLLKFWNKCKEDNATTRKKAEKYASNLISLWTQSEHQSLMHQTFSHPGEDGFLLP